MEAAQRLPRHFSRQLRGDHIFARGRVGPGVPFRSQASSSSQLPYRSVSGGVSADVWVGVHHAANCRTRAATPPRAPPPSSWPREEPKVSRKVALRQQLPRRLELRVLVQNTSGGPKSLRSDPRHPFHGTVISGGRGGGGFNVDHGGSGFGVDWARASVLFKAAEGLTLDLPVVHARLVGVSGHGGSTGGESPRGDGADAAGRSFPADACLLLAPLDAALYSATVALPPDVLVEPEFLSRALELRLPLIVCAPASLRLPRRSQTSRLPHDQLSAGSHGRSPPAARPGATGRGLAVARFVDEVELWEHYDEVRCVRVGDREA